MPDVERARPAPAGTGTTGYTRLPAGWKRTDPRGPGSFVTGELLHAPDGRVARWESRLHRRGGGARAQGSGDTSVWWRPHERGWWMAIMFAIGSACFAAGGIASQWASTSRPGIGVTFFAGSIFFTAAAYLQYSEAVNVERDAAAPAGTRRWRPASWEPRRIDWLAAMVQLIGTLLFNVSTFTAMNTGLSTHQYNARVWSPDVFGCVAFLIASELALAEVCHRWLCLKRRGLSWKIVAVNMLGSIAFAISAVASLVEPASGQPLSARIANAGTSVGGVCFLIGAILLMPEAARARHEVRERQEPGTGLASASP